MCFRRDSPAGSTTLAIHARNTEPGTILAAPFPWDAPPPWEAREPTPATPPPFAASIGGLSPVVNTDNGRQVGSSFEVLIPFRLAKSGTGIYVGAIFLLNPRLPHYIHKQPQYADNFGLNWLKQHSKVNIPLESAPFILFFEALSYAASGQGRRLSDWHLPASKNSREC